MYYMRFAEYGDKVEFSFLLSLTLVALTTNDKAIIRSRHPASRWCTVSTMW